MKFKEVYKKRHEKETPIATLTINTPLLTKENQDWVVLWLREKAKEIKLYANPAKYAKKFTARCFPISTPLTKTEEK